MKTFIFTEEMYEKLREKSYDLLSKKNNKIVYDLQFDNIIAIPDNEWYDFTIPIMVAKGKKFFIAEVNRNATLNGYFSDMEIALGTKIFKNERIKKIATKLFNKNDMRNYKIIKEIIEQNNYDIEKSIGQYSAWLDVNINGIMRSVM